MPGGSAVAGFETRKTGWVVGGGVETSLGPSLGVGSNWSLKLEYLYVDLGDVTNAIGTGLLPLTVFVNNFSTFGTATGSTSFFGTSHVREQIIRVGINYRFGYAAVAAVATKY